MDKRTSRAARTADRAEDRALPAAPRFAAAWAALVYAVATLLLGWQALAGKFLVNELSDQYIAGYAFREFQASWVRGGHGIPQWNPFQFGGMPYIAAMHGDIFYPTAWLRVLLGTDVGMTWGFILHVFLAGMFTYLFLRAAGLGFTGALVGGLAYMMAGNVAGLVSPGHDGKLFVSALLPLVLYFVHRGIRDGRAWAWGPLAIAVTLAVLSPHPQLLQYLLIVAGSYALWLAFTAPEAGAALPRPVAVQRLAIALGAIGLGMLGGAIQYMPLMEYTPWSPRAGGAGWEHAISYSMPPEEMLNFYLPQFSGILDQYWGRNQIHFHSEYIGAAVLVLAGLAFGASGMRRRFVWFWAGAFVVSLLWALGGFTPFFTLIYHLVPGTKYFRAPSTMLYVVSFCVAVLAAVGAERALVRARPRYAVAWLGAAAVMAVLASIGGLSAVARAIVQGNDRLPPQYIELFLARVDANQSALMLGGWRSLVFVAAMAGVLVALWRGALPARAAAWAMAAVIALDLWSVERLYWRFSPPAAELYASDAAIDYLKTLPQPGRVAVFGQGLTGHIRDPYMRNGEGRAAGFMIHGVRSIVGYHGNELGRYQELSGWETDWPAKLANPNFRRLTNTRYLYSNLATPPIDGMRQVAGPTKNAAGNTIYLYEFAEDNPAAWVTPTAVKAEDAAVLTTILDPRFDVRLAALFAPDAPVQAAATIEKLPDPITVPVKVTRYEPGRISLTLDAPAPQGSALVVSENYYPGWTATVDGKPAPIGRADYVLTGVQLPAGARQVELTFASAPYATGKTITLAVLAAALLALVGGIVLDRRGRTPEPAAA